MLNGNNPILVIINDNFQAKKFMELYENMTLTRKIFPMCVWDPLFPLFLLCFMWGCEHVLLLKCFLLHHDYVVYHLHYIKKDTLISLPPHLFLDCIYFSDVILHDSLFSMPGRWLISSPLCWMMVSITPPSGAKSLLTTFLVRL